jgi:SAM-dependent methyltransferase
MHVLDVGCGAGDVSLLAASLVGPSGSVLGVDRSADSIALAERRAAHSGDRGRMRFEASELETLDGEPVFDAVVGRAVLMYQPDPAAIIRRLACLLRPGGLVVFHEFAMPMTRSVPEGPLFRQVVEWCLQTFDRAGFEIDMGSKLARAFTDAGLPAPTMHLSGLAASTEGSPVFDYYAQTLRSLLPAAERLGVVSPAEVDVDTLAARLGAEAEALRACVMPPPLVGAWARLS